MKLSEVPATVLVQSFLKAAKTAEVEAVVFFTEYAEEGKKGKSISRATSNSGPGGIARAAAALKFKGNAIESGAMMLHKLSPLLKPVPWWKRVWRPVQAAPEALPDVGAFTALDDVTRENYRKIVSAVLGAASGDVVYTALIETA